MQTLADFLFKVELLTRATRATLDVTAPSPAPRSRPRKKPHAFYRVWNAFFTALARGHQAGTHCFTLSGFGVKNGKLITAYEAARMAGSIDRSLPPSTADKFARLIVLLHTLCLDDDPPPAPPDRYASMAVKRQ